MSTWLFVRHAESVANAEGWLSGHLDVPLSPRGVAQAEALRERLAGVPIDRCLSSDLQRATETLRIALGGRQVPWARSAQLRERHMGVLERMDKARAKAGPHWAGLLAWSEGPPGGETVRDGAVRVLGQLAQVPPIDGTTLVLGHGSALKAVWGLLDGVAPDQVGRLVFHNTQVEQREVAPGRFAHVLAAIRP